MPADPLSALRHLAAPALPEPAAFVTQAARFMRNVPSADRLSEVQLLAGGSNADIPAVLRDLTRHLFWTHAALMAQVEDFSAREVLNRDPALRRDLEDLRRTATQAATAWAGNLTRDPGFAALAPMLNTLETISAEPSKPAVRHRTRPPRRG